MWCLHKVTGAIVFQIHAHSGTISGTSEGRTQASEGGVSLIPRLVREGVSLIPRLVREGVSLIPRLVRGMLASYPG